MCRLSLFLSLSLLGMLAACTSPTPTGPPDLSAYEPIDLSYTYDDSTIYWPTATERFSLSEISKGYTDQGYYYSAYAFSTPEHGGTHLDAPVHFSEGSWSTDEIPVKWLVRPAVVIDMSEKAAADADATLEVEDVESWEAEHGPIPQDSAVLLRTGWAQYWPDAKQYLGDDTPGDASNLHFPSFGLGAARFLVEQRGAALLGVDTASIDPGNSTDFPVHQVAGGANVPGLENIANLDQVPTTGAWIIALPMKIGGGSGGPVRIVALVPKAAMGSDDSPSS